MVGLTHFVFFEHLDKVVHMLASFLLTLLLSWSLGLEPIVVVAVAVCVGGLDEMQQLFQLDRSAETLDFITDGLASSLAECC